MPGNLKQASPEGVFPNYLYTSYNVSRSFPLLTTQYKDGVIERSLITDTINAARPIRFFRFTVRLTSTQVAELQQFYEDHHGGLIPFYFYGVGSTWDGTGNSSTGRYTVRFNNPGFGRTTDISLTNVSIELQEVA